MAMGLGADPDLPQCGFRFLVSGTWILAPAKAAVCASLLPNAARCASGVRPGERRLRGRPGISIRRCRS
jgi:hypothetical protein